VEEKYGKDDVADSSTDESEDEDGELVNEEVDAEISAALEAIRSRDPKIYQTETTFYTALDGAPKKTKESNGDKPMYLRDYHRKNLLENGGVVDDETNQRLPYVDEQDALKKSFMKQVEDEGQDNDNDGEDGFLIRKQKRSEPESTRPIVPDPTTANENPDSFLSDFFAARAWIPTDRNEFQPLNSDDEDDQALAEEFEHAYNLRFEDPEQTNKTIATHSREIIAQYSVRRKELSSRQKARQRERDRKEDAKKERQDEKKRLRALKVSEMEQKFEKIKEAAGLHGASVKIDDWTDILNGEWDDDEWATKMEERFGNDYYEQQDALDSGSKAHKPKWDDDIDIKDLVPDFKDDETPPPYDEAEEEVEETLATKLDLKKQARRDRRIIEALAEQSLPLDAELGKSSKSFNPFRYRDTSPTTFGLTPLDILAADDAQLNQYAGLKKLAAFRDPERKKKDKKNLGKKARLRAWRQETFGREDGPDPKDVFSRDARPAEEDAIIEGDGIVKGTKKRKRKAKGNKSQPTNTESAV
jgi:protein KRI1